MKRFFLTLALITGLLVAVPPIANAENITLPCGSGATYTLILPAGVATDGSKCSGPIVLDNRVTIIDDGAFKNSGLTSVVFPNNLARIGAGAFRMDSFGYSMKTITLPDSLKYIGDYAFSGNKLLQSIFFGNGLNYLGQYSLGLTGLTEVTLPSSLKKIEKSTFLSTPLVKINIPNSVTSIDSNAFERTNLVSITMPDSVETLGFRAFAESSLESVNLGGGLKKIESYAFSNTKLRSIILPSKLKEIGQGAFANTQLTNLEIPNSVTVIENAVFLGITTLARVSIPDGVVKLGPWAFERNYSLTSILYCGKLTGFPITPTCPPERKAAIDAKAAADKAAIDAKAAADKAAADKAAAELKARQEVEAKAAIEKFAAELKIKQEAAARAAALKKTTITCVKGKLTKKVTAVKPKCPTGYTIKK
jgi:hypothetical protein